MQPSIYHNGSLKSKPPRPPGDRRIIVANQGTSGSKAMNPQPANGYGQAPASQQPRPSTLPRQLSDASGQIYEMQALGRTQTMARNSSSVTTTKPANPIPNIATPPSKAMNVPAVNRVQTPAQSTYYPQYYRTPQYQQMAAYPPQYATQMAMRMQYPQMTTYQQYRGMAAPAYGQQVSTYPAQMTTTYRPQRPSTAAPPQRQPVQYMVSSKVGAPPYKPQAPRPPNTQSPQRQQGHPSGPPNTQSQYSQSRYGQNQGGPRGPAQSQGRVQGQGQSHRGSTGSYPYGQPPSTQSGRGPNGQAPRGQGPPPRGPPAQTPQSNGAYGSNYNGNRGGYSNPYRGNSGHSSNPRNSGNPNNPRNPMNSGNPRNWGSSNNANGSWNQYQNGRNGMNRPNSQWNGPNGMNNGMNRNPNYNRNGRNGANVGNQNVNRWAGPPPPRPPPHSRTPSTVSDYDRRPRHNGNHCRYYGSAMGCKWGDTCYQDHSNPNSIEFCPQFKSEWGCQWHDECWFRHIEFTDPQSARHHNKTSRKYAEYTALEHRDDDDNIDNDDPPISVESETVSNPDAPIISGDDGDPVTPSKEREMETVYKVSPDRKTEINVDQDDDDEKDPQQNRMKRDGHRTSKRSSSKRKQTAFSKLDKSLAAYYEDMGRRDYYNEVGTGKFMEFVEINGFDDEQMEEQLGHNVEAMDCLYLDMDQDFPLKKTYKTTDERNEAIFNVLQDCYRLGRKSRSITPKMVSPNSSPKENGIVSKLKYGSPRILSVSKSANSKTSQIVKRNVTPIPIRFLTKLRCTDLEKKEEGCSYMNSMISTLRHYSKLDVTNNPSDKAEFMEFMGQNLTNLLNDYRHIMEGHPPSDIELIQKQKSAEFELFSACVPNNCLMLVPKDKEPEDLCPAFGSAGGCKWGNACTKSHANPNSVRFCDNFLKPEGCQFGRECYFRHQNWPKMEKCPPVDGGEIFVFYRDLMDSMHCYLIHSHDVEYRIKVRHRMKPEDRKVDEAKWKIWGDDRFRYKSTVGCGQHDVFIFKGINNISRSD